MSKNSASTHVQEQSTKHACARGLSTHAQEELDTDTQKQTQKQTQTYTQTEIQADGPSPTLTPTDPVPRAY
jgi:hypothetical protein